MWTCEHHVICYMLDANYDPIGGEYDTSSDCYDVLHVSQNMISSPESRQPRKPNKCLNLY